MSRPLIHVIANHVSRSFIADGIHAYGGSPIMSEWLEEFDTLHQHAKALVVSLGMLDPLKKEVICAALSSANKKGLLVGLDPVGIHLSKPRYDFYDHLMKHYDIAYVRGNYDEINCAFHGFSSAVKGLVSLESERFHLTPPSSISKKTIYIATGHEDLVFQEAFMDRITGGSPKLRQISGAGCLLTPLIALGILKAPNARSGVIGALKDFKSASESADASGIGIGHFKIHLLDALERRSLI